MESKKKKNSYLSYALLTFLAFAIEIGLVTIEYMLYGIGTSQWNLFQSILHWSLTCFLWGVSGFYLFSSAKKELNFNPFTFKSSPTTKQYVFALILGLIFVTYMSYLWNWQFKPFAEFKGKINSFGSLGIVAFIFQNIYYLFESALMFLLIAFGQEYGEKRFKSNKIPWGGILLALTWGLGHIFTKDLAVGLFGLFWGISFGIIYLLMNKNPRYTYPFIALLFIM